MQFPVALLVTLFFAFAAVARPAVGGLTARTTVSTPLGPATGTPTIPGVQRFVVQYATAARWKAPVMSTTLQVLTTLPPVCPQLTSSGFAGAEDCLYVVFYVPMANFSGSTLVWIHGGSLLVGGASDPTIEGSKLALETKSIVAVVQYRLGVLGYLPPVGSSANPNSNLGVRDVVAALTFIKTFVPNFGASQSAITVAGQSAGAFQIRALLASPSASKLFQKAAMQSDTADYGFFKQTTITAFQNYFYPSVNCSVSDYSCQSALSLASIMNAQANFLPNAASLDSASSGPMPLRPVVDGQLITTTLTTSFPASLKPILVTNVAYEAGPLVYGNIPTPLPPPAFAPVLENFIPDSRSQAVLNSSYYTLDPNNPDTVRIELTAVISDLAFRCPDWDLAKAWAQRGGKAWIGQFQIGALHPDNAAIPFCADNACHENDIPIVFGTATSPTAAQAALITEIQARYNSFIHSGNPNAAGFATWSQTTASSFNILPLGGSGPVDTSACTSFWGTPSAQFDYQIYNL